MRLSSGHYKTRIGFLLKHVCFESVYYIHTNIVVTIIINICHVFKEEGLMVPVMGKCEYIFQFKYLYRKNSTFSACGFLLGKFKQTSFMKILVYTFIVSKCPSVAVDKGSYCFFIKRLITVCHFPLQEANFKTTHFMFRFYHSSCF